MKLLKPSFSWDLKKEQINLSKHGVDFRTAEKAFADKDRKIYFDSAHSNIEKRYFCLGNVYGEILTVRFAYRGNTIRIIGAGYWRRGRKYYETKKHA